MDFTITKYKHENTSWNRKNILIILVTFLLMSPIFLGEFGARYRQQESDVLVKNVVASYGNQSQRNFINRVGQAARKDRSGIFPSITIAQAILESGWGNSTLSSQHNNLFGIKAGGWDGRTVNIPAREYTGNGWIETPSYFRAYNSFEESISDHSAFLKQNSRYTMGGVFSSRNYVEQAYAIQNSGYASDPNYASTLISIIETYNLYEFDV